MAITIDEKEVAQRIFEFFKPNGDLELKKAQKVLEQCRTPAEMETVMKLVKEELNEVRARLNKSGAEVDDSPRDSSLLRSSG